jgi:hypothetical protein
MNLVVIRPTPTTNEIKYKREGDDIVIRCSYDDFEELRNCINIVKKKRHHQRQYRTKLGTNKEIKPTKKDIEFVPE